MTFASVRRFFTLVSYELWRPAACVSRSCGDVAVPAHAAVVTLLPPRIDIVASTTDALLTSMAREGLRYRHGCRRGGCGACMADVVNGKVIDERPVARSVVNEHDREAGVILLCRAVPVSDVTVRVRDASSLRWATPYSQRLAANHLEHHRAQSERS